MEVTGTAFAKLKKSDLYNMSLFFFFTDTAIVFGKVP